MSILSRLMKSFRHSLTLRIAALILISGPIVLIAFDLLSLVFFGVPDHPVSIWFKILHGIFALLVTTFIIGWLTSRLVTRPLKSFNQAIQSLQASKYKMQLKNSGIAEFDKVFKSFIELSTRLRQEEELRKNLISDTSHELNTPLSAIAGQLTAMQEDKLPITKMRIGTIKEQTDRLIELVEQLNAYTQARTRNTDEVHKVNVKHICQQTINEIGHDLTIKGIEPVLKVSENLFVECSPAALQQILINLLHNTLRYSEASKLTITANSDGMTYSDNGRGVPAESLQYLFERFYRVDKSRNRSTGGLGLGLAIVKELAQQQGWEIRAETAYPGLAIAIKFAD